MAWLLPLVLCLALGVAPGCVSRVAPAGTSEPPGAQTGAPAEDETLQNEADNQENVLSQLLGDYDKVKAVAEGSDCQCRCVVRPLGRDACQRAAEGTARKEDVYTVETITSGSSCKCACVAPPSALNPCEGDFRLQKLREADSRDLKLSTVIDMLEGALYGLDLLKLHSVTTRLVGRVDKLEEEVSRNLTKENKQIRDDVEGIRTEMNKRGRENCPRDVPERGPDARSAVQRDAAAAYAHPQEQYEERFLREETVSQQVNAIELLQTRPLAPPEARRPQRPLQRQVLLRGRPASRPTVIRGVTYYKAKEPEEENDIEEQHDFFSGDNGVDLLIEDQLLRHDDLLTSATRRPAAAQPGAAVTADTGPETTALPSAQPRTSTPVPRELGRPAPTPGEWLTAPPPVFPEPPEAGRTPAPQTPAATVAPTSPPAAPGDTFPETAPPAPGPPTAGPDTQGQGTASPSPAPGPDEDDIRNVIGRCKDTLSTITGPTTQNTYGRNEGAWMKDPLAKDERIYVTNYYYGNTLMEFRNLESFKQGRWSNSYKLPYSWVGTGHVVYGGALYYSRAFTRNIIKYDLRLRFVAAWALLHDVAYAEATPWSWHGHSDVDFAVDENGLWLIYPALDDGGSSQEVIVLSKLDAADLSTRKETTWRTGLRRHVFGNCFVICGVLYAVDSRSQRNANISYAFDTHTNTQTVPRLLFENEYAYTTQVDYNPKDRLLYAWDNGHQVTYHVIFAY
ncbi:olfactomedin-like protein 2B isoform X3 [Pteropus medius]|uniref:olfactomedin-like protein 2B isoform X3 n=1 Tax=Pteropus vampyrus TaxID=132908 RepID=UPI00196AFA41|nr:olfactomedin-like protein 2B isoform X3 [Pteropus giganteus]